MTKELKDVIWDWLPGIVAGVIPLLVFLFVSIEAPVPADVTPEAWWVAFNSGLVDHLLILAMVTSTVSTFMTIPRLLSQRVSTSAKAPIALVMLITIILIFSVAMYVLREAGTVETPSLWASGFPVALGLALAAAVISYYLEVTLANLRLRKTTKRSNVTAS